MQVSREDKKPLSCVLENSGHTLILMFCTHVLTVAPWYLITVCVLCEQLNKNSKFSHLKQWYATIVQIGMIGVGVRLFTIYIRKWFLADVTEACVYVGPVIIKMWVCTREWTFCNKLKIFILDNYTHLVKKPYALQTNKLISTSRGWQRDSTVTAARQSN